MKLAGFGILGSEKPAIIVFLGEHKYLLKAG
jgi:hypothetical protein